RRRGGFGSRKHVLESGKESIISGSRRDCSGDIEQGGFADVLASCIRGLIGAEAHIVPEGQLRSVATCRHSGSDRVRNCSGVKEASTGAQRSGVCKKGCRRRTGANACARYAKVLYTRIKL